MASLEELDFCNNELKGLPEFIRKLKKLRRLCLRHNSIDRLAINTFEELTDLEELCLSNNNLDDLPASLKRMTNLRILDLSYNKNVFGRKFRTDLFESLLSLEELRLRQTKIDRFPDAIRILSRLKILDLSEMRFEIYLISYLRNWVVSRNCIFSKIS